MQQVKVMFLLSFDIILLYGLLHLGHVITVHYTINFMQGQGLAKSRSHTHVQNLLLLSKGGKLPMAEMTQTIQ